MKKELLEKIRNAQIIESPFPHVVIDDFLPEDYFNCLSDLLHINGCTNDSDLISKVKSKATYKKKRNHNLK
jgi:hypothetical protein